jgi:hypothetical protein
MSECLEHMKLLSTVGKRQLIHEFMTWLMDERHITLDGQSDSGSWKRINRSEIEKLTEQFFGIDSDELDQEEVQLEVETVFKQGRLP